VPALRVTCQHCQKVTVIDSEKVPDQPVSYRCPNCQSKVIIDKRKLLAQDAGEAAPAAATAAAAPGPARAAAAAERTPSSGERASGSFAVAPDSLLEMALPPGESIPPGLLVAEDKEAGAQIKRQLEPYDCVLETVADAATARERALLEPPPLILYAAETVSKPPYAAIEPLVSLPPRERRQVFVVLMANNVKTLDGNLAFLYGVNLLLSRQHLAQAPGILYSALRYHQRLYKPFLAAVGE
jgi:hypothetical protein